MFVLKLKRLSAKRIARGVLASTLLVSCVKGPKVLKSSYVIGEQSRSKRPKWIGSTENAGKAYPGLYVQEGNFESINKRVCENGGETAGRARIVAQIQADVANAFNQVDTVDSNETKTKAVNKISGEIKNKISGLELKDRYWEQRQYLKSLGAEKDRTVYSCHTLFGIEKDKLDKVIDAATKSLESKYREAIKEQVENMGITEGTANN